VNAYLLDTHVLLVLLLEPRRVPSRLRDELSSPDSPRWVSAVSAMKIATKVRIGRLDVARSVVVSWPERLVEHQILKDPYVRPCRSRR